MNKVKQIKKEASVIKASFFYLKTFILLVFIFSASSCISVKTNTEKSAKSLFTTFYIGDKGTQYFIKPLSFINQQNESFLADFTFRHQTNNDSALATINVSLLLNENIEIVDSIAFYGENYLFSVRKVSLLYKEKKDNQILIRISSKAPLAQVSSLFNFTKWKTKVFVNAKEFSFQSTKKTNKSIPLLQSAIFELLAIQ